MKPLRHTLAFFFAATSAVLLVLALCALAKVHAERFDESIFTDGLSGRDSFLTTEDASVCSNETHHCHEKALCMVGHQHLTGYKECQCIEGYQGDGYRNCVDIDECKHPTSDHKCHRLARCTNLEGTFKCTCPEGYFGDAINECLPSDCSKFRPWVPNDCSPPAHPFLVKEKPIEQAHGLYLDLHDSDDGPVAINQTQTQLRYKDPGWTVYKAGGALRQAEVWFELPHDLSEGTHTIEITTREEGQEASVKRYRMVEVTHIENECPEGDEQSCTSHRHPLTIELGGPNPLVLNKCGTYEEKGFILATTKDEMLRVVTMVPSALMAPHLQEIGNFTVTYTISGKGNKMLATVERLVIVNAVNPCELPVEHPCGHKCHPYAKCVYHKATMDYDCQCREGYGQVTDRITGEIYCQDNKPPVISLGGDNPTILRSCRVCNWYDLGEVYSDSKYQSYSAYDEQLFGRKKDLTPSVTVTNESLGLDQWAIYYNVKDDVGNEAQTGVRIVQIEVEDVNKKIAFLESRLEELKLMITEDNIIFSYGCWIFRLFGSFGIFVSLWISLPRFLGFVQNLT